MESGARITMDCGVRQLGKGEDFVFAGNGIDLEEGNQPFHFILVMDGHGGKSCIGIIREMSVDELTRLVAHRDPVMAIGGHIRMHRFAYATNSGATLSLAKVYGDRVKTFNVGDSRTFVYVNGQLAHTNKIHDIDNPAEAARLSELFARNGEAYQLESSRTPQVLSPTRMTMIKSDRVYYPSGAVCAVTQSMGHHDEFGYAPDVGVVEFSEKDVVSVVAATDGLFDIVNLNSPAEIDALMTMDSPALLDFAESRWKQSWEYVDTSGSVISADARFPDWDDVGVATLTVAGL